MDFSLFFENNTSRNHVGESQHGFLPEAVRFAEAHLFCAIWLPQRAFNAPQGNGEPTVNDVVASGSLAVRTVSQSLPNGSTRPATPVWIAIRDDSEGFRTAARTGAYVLTYLLGRSIESLAKDIALYRRTWAESGRAGHGYVTIVTPTLISNGDATVNQAVRVAMQAHLRQETALLREAAWDFPPFVRASEDDGITIDQFLSRQSSSEFDELLQFSVERYIASGSLSGTPRHCLSLVERLKNIGVDEIACLLDFGWPASVALQRLPALNELRLACASGTAVSANNGSSAAHNGHTAGPAPMEARATVAKDCSLPRHTETQQKMVALWKLLLDVPEIDLGDNFFDLGGHSLLAARAVSEIDRTFGTSLSVKTLMVSSLSQIASEVDRLATKGHNGDNRAMAAASESPKVGRLSSYFKNAGNGDRFQDGGTRAE
jgi:alkanesulfonate monooxygenase SsuD/methylene tetrahydromethanopterin reductase-like flavin-dependent oxidoreductase (luciferase family)